MDAAGDAFNSVLNFFGIGSPSKLMRKEVGRWIPAGIATGINDSAYMIKDSLDNASKEALTAGRYSFTGLDAYKMTKGSGMGALTSSYSPISGGNVTNQTVNQTINSAKVLTPREIALQTKNTLKRLKWAS